MEDCVFCKLASGEIPGMKVYDGDRIVAMPDKIPFYEKFGFSANEAQRLRIMYQVHG